MPSYGSDTDFLAYLTATGRTLPSGADASVARHYGTVYVDSWEDQYRGRALTTENSFPRNLWNPVPVAVEHAAYEAGFAWASGVDIFGSGGTSGGQVVREKVDVLEVQYAAPEAGSGWWEANRFVLPLAYALLLPFMRRKEACGCGGSGIGVLVV